MEAKRNRIESASEFVSGEEDGPLGGLLLAGEGRDESSRRDEVGEPQAHLVVLLLVLLVLGVGEVLAHALEHRASSRGDEGNGQAEEGEEVGASRAISSIGAVRGG